MSGEPRWTHPSVLELERASHGRDPLEEIARRAEDLALHAMESGWSGPPYDPFELADFLGVEVVGREDLDDARLVSTEGVSRIEFNPHRRPARVRFSVAHEIGHYLFDDHAEQIRYRAESHGEATRPDDWQLEMLCNIAAAELLMPAGAFPVEHLDEFSLPHLLDLRARFGVSTEALLRRVVRVTDVATCMFAAAHNRDVPGFRLDYAVGSRGWRDPLPDRGAIPAESVLARCTAVGYSDSATEVWGAREVYVQAVGIPPYPGDRLPRVIGLLQHAEQASSVAGLRYVRGDATEPRGGGARIIAHVVNDQAHRWSSRGFAGALMRRYPGTGESYERWVEQGGDHRLGAVHVDTVGEGISVASLIAQAGYGELRSGRPRLRVSALKVSLEQLAVIAREQGASVHMPLIGTGQAGGSWPVVRDLVLAELVDRDIETIVYVLPEQPMPHETAVGQLSLV